MGGDPDSQASPDEHIDYIAETARRMLEASLEAQGLTAQVDPDEAAAVAEILADHRTAVSQATAA